MKKILILILALFILNGCGKETIYKQNYYKEIKNTYSWGIITVKIIPTKEISSKNITVRGEEYRLSIRFNFIQNKKENLTDLRINLKNSSKNIFKLNKKLIYPYKTNKIKGFKGKASFYKENLKIDYNEKLNINLEFKYQGEKYIIDKLFIKNYKEERIDLFDRIIYIT